ncbi:MAG: hypothetical protein KC621_32305, partial [Myxococcales bacterium]|nr:hypothetical protein [Myxococcales bacterium]
MRWPSLLPTLALGCALSHTAAHDRVAAEPGSLDVEPAAAPTDRLNPEAIPDGLDERIESWFDGHGSRRLHVQLDRPMLRPGETVWVKSWNLATRTLTGEGAGAGVTYELLDPRGTIVETKRVLQADGTATNDFVLPTDAPGGRWSVRLTAPTGETVERPFVVSSYQAPTIRKKLDFVREAYGPGDRVEALVELLRPSGEPLADHAVHVMLQVDGATVAEEDLRTDGTGAVLASGRLPSSLSSGDGLLVVLVEEGGISESISRSVPIVLADLRLDLFPEGGDLVAGLPGRVYFEGRDRHGEPADVAGVIEDDRGRRVATFESVHDGLGRFAFTPERGRTYRARVTAPEGIDTAYPLPEAMDQGCTLRSYDDLRSELPEVRVGVRCTSRQDVVVVGTQRERRVDTAAVRAGPDRDAVVHLARTDATRQGAVRVTVFDPSDLAPLAERLVYRGAGRDLAVALTTDRQSYGPRDEVVIGVRTTGPDGEPVPAELALAVADDGVLSLADDREGNLLSRVYLEPELVEVPEDPGFYYDREEVLAARGLDLVMGTRGWRRFDWAPVLDPQPPTVTETVATRGPFLRLAERLVDDVEETEIVPMAMPMPEEVAEVAQPVVVAEPMDIATEDRRAQRLEKDAEAMGARQIAAGRRARRDIAADEDMLGGLGYLGYVGDMPWGGEVAWAPVRVFPRPDHASAPVGVRTDFRDTVLWEPTVRTDDQGRAEVRFALSDAITTFRVTAEGAGGGAVGHGEATLSSVLPVSVGTKLPAAVSAGDQLMLPITVTSARAEALTVAVGASLTSELLTAGRTSERLKVAPRGSATSWIPITVGSGRETATLRLTAEGGGAQDAVERTLEIVPPGF